MATTYLWLHNRKRFLTATNANTTTKFGWIDACRNHDSWGIKGTTLHGKPSIL